MQKLKLIVDFHTDIDFKLGKLRVGGRGMFSAVGEDDNIVDTQPPASVCPRPSLASAPPH